MATLLDGYTQNWKHLTVDLSKQWKLSDSQIETMNKYGYTYSYINEPKAVSNNPPTISNPSSGSSNSNYNPLPDAGYTGGGSSGGWKTIEPPKTWENYWSKMNNPAEISKYLNGQSGFTTKVLGDRIVGAKNWVKTVWKFDGTNWVSELQKGWDHYAKLNDPAEVAFYLNSQDNFNVKTAGNKISGTKDGVETTWSFVNGNWSVSATAKDTAVGKSGGAAASNLTSTSSTSMKSGTTTTPTDEKKKDLPPTEDSPKDEPTQDWGTYGTMPDAEKVTTYLNTQPNFNTYVARDPVSNEVIPGKIEGTKDWVKASWSFNNGNWERDPSAPMNAGEVTSENITTAQLNKLITDKGLDPAAFTGKQKSAYDRLVIKAQENDKKATEDTEKTDEKGDEISETEKSINKMLDDKKDVNELLVETAREWVKILKEKIDNIVKPMQEQYDKLSAEWWAQEEKFKAEYEKQWADVERYENESRVAIKELEDLGRKQYKDYVSRVARVVSWRKSGIAGELSAQGFNANVIGNITSQVDSQYADERLKVQTFLSDVLDKSLSRQRDLYTDLFNRRSSLTAAEQGFRNTVGERYKYLSTLKQNIAETINTMFEPIENINKTLTGAYSTVDASSATGEAYEQEWKQGTEDKRIAQLSSQLHNFLGSEKNADGTAKYDTNTIPTEKLAEWAQMDSGADAYRAAVDYLTNWKGASGPDSSLDKTVAAGKESRSSIDTGSGKKTSPAAPATTAPAATSTTANLTEAQNTILTQAKMLNEKGGFAKTNTSYEAFAQLVQNAKTPEEITKLAAMIEPAITATPAVKSSQDLTAKKTEAFSPYGWLTPAQKEVVKKSPLMKDVLAVTQEITAVTNEYKEQSREDSVRWALKNFVTGGGYDEQLMRLKARMQSIVTAALAGKTTY